MTVNAEGVARLTSACAQHHVTLILVSTDQVFDGSKNGAYTEADAYGTSEATG